MTRLAVDPVTVKSRLDTFCTCSLKVTNHRRLSALVGVVVGKLRSIEVAVGAVLSTTKVKSFVPVGAVSVRLLFAMSLMSCPVAKDRVTVSVRPSRLPPLAVTS